MKLSAAMFFRGVLAIMASTGMTNRQQRMHDRLMVKEGRHRDKGLRSLKWYQKRKRLRKIAKLSRRKNRAA